MQNTNQQPLDIQKEEALNEDILVVSIGTHIRLGDVLEFALADTAFDTVDSESFLCGVWESRRMLFAISADATGENAQLRALTAILSANPGILEGCACTAIVDGASGGEAHLDMVRLLRAANDAGASVLTKPLLESGRELRQFVHGKETPFTQYRIAARELVARLQAAQMDSAKSSRVRFVTALEGGAAHDWREYLSRLIERNGGELADIGEPDETILLCENNTGLPDEKTFSLLSGSGKLNILLASPAAGSDLYTACLIERACLRGNYTLPPSAVLVFKGLSAAETMASKAEMERVKTLFLKNKLSAISCRE